MVEAITCSQCGAGLSAKERGEERECAYCGSVLRVPDARSRRPDKEHNYVRPKHCPRCHHRTVQTEVDDCRFRACHHCGGVWIPRKALSRFGNISKKDRRELKRLNRSNVQRKTARARARHGALHCPQCARTMTHHLLTKGATITVDVCHKHGAWFDEDELLVAHRDIAGRMNLRSERGRRWRHSRRRWDGWELEALYVVFRVLAEIIDEVFD